jgi:DNA polymerase-3 subunit epsilon/exodeoxyribonuclease X
VLIFLDIETTGYEREDKICSLGVLTFEDDACVSAMYELVNEDKKIPPSASALHNITNEMIEKKPPLKESEIYAFLQKNDSEKNTLIVHNAAFVLEKLHSAGLTWHGKIIDTFKVVKHLIPECELFTPEFLRYELKLYRDEEALKKECGIKDAFITHHALSDAAVIKLLFDYLTQMTTLDEMNRLSFENVLLEKFSFGKYSGRYIEDIAMNDRGYLMWMLSLENLDDDLRYSIEYYLGDFI